MPYTEADFARMDTDPAFARQYFWRCAMGMKRLAAERRRRVRAMAVSSSPVGFRDLYEAGQDELELARVEEATADAVLANLDALVKNTGPR